MLKRKNWAQAFSTAGENEDKRTGGIGPRGFDKHSVNGIRSSSNAAIAVPPRGVPTPQNFTEKYSLRKTILRWDPASSNSAPADNQLHGFIYTPSNRLIVTVQMYMEPDNILAADPTFTVAPTWTLRRMIINSASGRESPASQFYPSVGSANLPDEVIIPDAPELLRASVNTIGTDQFNTNAYTTTPVSLILQVKWEPDVQTIPREELMRLYERCRINAGIPLIIANVLIP